MGKGNLWFWVFAIVQLIFIYFFGVNVYGLISQSAGLSARMHWLEQSWMILVILSTVGIEYLIYSKK